MTHRLLADEQFDMAVVRLLRKKGHDVLTVRDISDDKAGDSIADDAIFAFAQQTRRAVVTFNVKHFRPLAFRHAGRHHGVVLCQLPERGRKIETQQQLAKAIDAAIRSSDSLRGAVIAIPAKTAEEEDAVPP